MDFEFHQPPGEVPLPLCVSWLELRAGKLEVAWLEGESFPEPAFPTGDDVLFLAFTITAEISCFHVLGWKVPANWIDCYVEERATTNGAILDLDHRGRGLLDVLARYDIPHTVTEQMKDEMRQLAMRGGPFTPEEKKALLDYCSTDVVALEKLFPRMLPPPRGSK